MLINNNSKKYLSIKKKRVPMINNFLFFLPVILRFRGVLASPGSHQGLAVWIHTADVHGSSCPLHCVPQCWWTAYMPPIWKKERKYLSKLSINNVNYMYLHILHHLYDTELWTTISDRPWKSNKDFLFFIPNIKQKLTMNSM